MDDLISRQAAIDEVVAWMKDRLNNKKNGKPLTEILRELPSAQPERMRGRWVPVTNGRGGYECDQCHNYAPSYQDGVEWLSDFCPECGARMEEN